MVSSVVHVVSGLFGIVYVLFLPGFLWSFCLLRHRQVTLGERMTIGVMLSFILVPLVAYYLNRLLHVPVTQIAIYGESTTISVAALALWWLGRRFK